MSFCQYFLKATTINKKQFSLLTFSSRPVTKQIVEFFDVECPLVFGHRFKARFLLKQCLHALLFKPSIKNPVP